MKKIILSTRQELNIYMSPARQELLRIMSIKGIPVTPKELSDCLSISPSSVQHHMKKLLLLGVVELDHQEMIRGITASYYRLSDAEISFESREMGEYIQEHEALISSQISQVVTGFYQMLGQCRQNKSLPEEHAHYSVGILHVTETERLHLLQLIQEFCASHNVPTQETMAWEFALIAHECENRL